jgi:hypothetical protein
MNERIFTELYKKAWGHFPCPTGEPELKRFAELIVAECLKQADIIRDDCDGDGQKLLALGAEWAALAIARHFGVES